MKAKSLKKFTSLFLTIALLLSTVFDSGMLTAMSLITGNENLDVIVAYADSYRTTATATNQYWYNGHPNINPQADNTFRYEDGGTNGQVFTSELPPENMEVVDSTFGQVLKIRVYRLDSVVSAGQHSYQELTFEELDYFKSEASTGSTIGEQMASAYPAAGAVIRRTMEAIGLNEDNSWSEYIAGQFGYSSIDALQADVNKMFYQRNLWRLSTNGETSWCLEPKLLIGGGLSTVDATTLMGTDQRSYLLGLIVSAANSMGAETDDGIYQAAQALIWELMGGLLNYHDLSHKSTSGYYNGMIVGNNLQSQYEAIKLWISELRKIPSFLVNDYTYSKSGCKTYYYGVTWNEDHFDLDDELILKDWNGLVLDWRWEDKGVYHFEPIDAYTLKVTASAYSADPMGATKFTDEHGDNTLVGTMTFTGSAQDQVVLANLYDPYAGWMNIAMRAGISLKEDREGGFPISGNTGAQITISGPGYDGSTVYDVNDLPLLYEPGTYTITEIHAPTFVDKHLGYVKDASPITISISDETEGNWYTYNGTSLKNTRQKGQIVIQKKDEAKTYLNHLNEYQEYIDCTVCHDNFLSCGHTTEEWNTELATYTTNYVGRGVLCVICENTFPQCGCNKASYIEAFKVAAPLNIDNAFYADRDMRITNPLPQGDATLAGAVFEIYAEEDIILANGDVLHRAGSLVETITTDSKGLAKSSNLDLGVYRVKEKTPPTGYQYWRYKDKDELQFVVDIVYSGDENEAVQEYYLEYGDSVIAGHLSLKKVVSHDDHNDIFDNDAAQVAKDIPANGVYYAIYLKSKQNSDPNSFANTRLPDEFFIPTSFDDEAPICKIVDGQGEIIDGLHYGCYEYVDNKGNPTGEKINPTLQYPIDTDKTNAAIKSLYMILRTNETGQAATHDATTIAYIAIPGVGGEMDNDAGREGNEMNVYDKSYPLPYGTYIVTELNAPEGYNLGYVEVNGVKGEYGPVTFEFTVGNECKVSIGEAPYTKTELNNKHFDLINHIVHQKIYVYKVDNEYYVREKESQGGEEVFELVPSEGLIEQPNIKFKLWCWNNTGNGEYGLTYDADDIGNEEMGYWYEYTYFDYPNEIVVDTFATDDNGRFVLPTPLVYGDYALVELNAPYGYWLPDANNTDIENVPKNEDGSYQSWIGYTDPSTGEFVWTVDKYGNTYENPIAAASFSVTNPDPEIRVMVDVENAAQKGYIVLNKEGLRLSASEEVVNGKYTETHPIFTDMGLAGATYAIYADGDVYTGDFLRYVNGEKVAEFTTDGRGIGVSEPIHLGKYILKETKAPFGYLLDETEYKFELTYKGEEIRIYPVEQERYDVRQEVEFEILKESEEEDGTFVPSTGNIKFGLYAAQDFVNHIGEVVITTDSLVEVIDIINGEGNSTLMLPVGKYYVKELETNDGLAMDYNKYPVEFKFTADGSAYDNPEEYDASITGAGKGETKLTITLNEGVAIKNYRKRADVEIFKSNSKAPATLETVVPREVLMFDYDENGVVDNTDKVIFTKLVSGKIATTEEYMLLSDVDKDNALTDVDAQAIKDVLVDQTVNTKVILGPSKTKGMAKQVSNTSDAHMLAGVEFTLYDDNNIEIAVLKTNEHGYAYYNGGLTIGRYKLVETKGPDGFKFDPLNPLVKEFEVTTAMYNTVLTYEFVNNEKDGILITKKDVSTGALIPECKIVIKNELGEVVVTGITDKNGEIFFELAPGKYTYQELEAPKGYQIETKEFPFEILENGGIVKAVMTNKKIPTPTPDKPDEPQPSTSIGVIKIYMGKGVWNPATGGLVQIDTEVEEMSLTGTEQIEPVSAYAEPLKYLNIFAISAICLSICFGSKVYLRKRKTDEEI